MQTDLAKRIKQLEQENSRLRKMVADLSMDNAILLRSHPIGERKQYEVNF